MPIPLESFVAWLCEHETDIIGESSRNFSCPLANFLSELFHHVTGVDGHLYGRASHQWWQWKPLPAWAVAFTLFIDQQGYRPVTGLEALCILADVELMISTQREKSRFLPFSQGCLPIGGLLVSNDIS